MKEILQNLALIDLTNFCKENNIPANGYGGEGTHLAKNGRGFKWSLVSDKTGRTIVTVSFHKNSVPTYSITPEERA